MSLHGANNFPFKKQVGDPMSRLPTALATREYLTALMQHLPVVPDETEPDIVFYLAGADPYVGDRLGKLGLSIDGLRERDRYVFEQCRTRVIPVVVAMSGGYATDIDAIVTIHTNTIAEAVRSDRCH